MTAAFRMMRNSAATLVAHLISQGLRAVYVILAARYLSESDFGFYSFSLSLCLVLTILSTLGLETIVVRELASLGPDDTIRRRTLFGSVLAYEFVLALLVGVALVGIGRWQAFPREKLIAFLLLGGGLILRQLSESLMGIVRGHERMEFEIVFGVVEGVGLVGLALLFWGMGLGFIGVFLAYGLTYLLQFSIGFIFVGLKFYLPSFGNVGRDFELLIKAAPLGFGRLMGSLGTNAGPLLLPLLRSELDAGIYGAAYQPLKGLFLVTVSLGVGVLPVFSQLYASGDDETLSSSSASSLKYTVMLVLPMTIGLFAFPEQVLQILYGGKYMQGAIVLRVLSLVILLTFLNTLLTNLLVAMHRQRAVGIGRALSVVANLGLLFLLTSRMGPVGPALALLGGELLVFLAFALHLTFSYRRFPLTATLGRPMLGSLPMLAVAWLARGLSMWVAMPLALTVYLLTLWLLKCLGPDDWALLRSLSHSLQSRFSSHRRVT